MMHHRTLIGLFLLAVSASGRADIHMRDVFAHMPDSIVPTLTANNRLDMIDFFDSNMKAEVTNLLSGKSELVALGDDSLTIKVSEAYTLKMLLIKSPEPVDSGQMICLCKIYGIKPTGLSTKVEFYTTEWKRVNEPPNVLPSEQGRIDAVNMQTILKWDDEILKKQ